MNFDNISYFFDNWIIVFFSKSLFNELLLINVPIINLLNSFPFFKVSIVFISTILLLFKLLISDFMDNLIFSSGEIIFPGQIKP